MGPLSKLGAVSVQNRGGRREGEVELVGEEFMAQRKERRRGEGRKWEFISGRRKEETRNKYTASISHSRKGRGDFIASVCLSPFLTLSILSLVGLLLPGWANGW